MERRHLLQVAGGAFAGAVVVHSSPRAAARTVRLPDHSFAITRIHQAPVSGMVRNSIRLERYGVVEADVYPQRQQPLVIN